MITAKEKAEFIRYGATAEDIDIIEQAEALGGDDRDGFGRQRRPIKEQARALKERFRDQAYKDAIIRGTEASADDRVMIDGAEYRIIGRDWKQDESPCIVTTTKGTLPTYTVSRWIIRMEIEGPVGTYHSLHIEPKFRNQARRLNPVSIKTIQERTRLGGLTGKEEIIQNAMVQFAEQERAEACFVDWIVRESPQAASEFWKSKAGPQLHAELVQDLGTRLEHDNERDGNGDIQRFVNWRAVMRARMVDCDLRLVVDVDGEPEDKRLEGMSISSFEGLNRGKNGVTVAVFRGGRALRLIDYRTTPISDPHEITARELTLARRRTEAAEVKPQVDPAEPATEMLSTAESARYARRSEKTIKNWTKALNHKNEPMLPGAVKVAGKWRIPRCDLTPYRAPERQSKQTPKPAKKTAKKECVK